MKKLRNKVFWTIYSIMTGALLLVVVIYISQSYIELQHFIAENFNSPFIDPRYKDFVFQGFANNLRTSIIVFIILAIAFFIISRLITNWIVKPTEVAFSKQKDFIADASHELKTPLAVIMASNDAIEKNENNTRWINNIKNEADRMNHLITKLLDLASTENIANSKLKNGNLSKTVELAALIFDARALARSCKLRLDIQNDIQFKYNEDDIKQLVEILLDNALEHSNKNTTVELSLHQENGKAILKVVNEGKGISKGDEEKIFERFYRADKSRTGEGNRYGLGLAIAKNIVQNHQGQISATSSNKRTTFKVVF